MSVISVFSASHCGAEEIPAILAEELGYRLISDEEVLDWAAEHFKFSRDKLARAVRGGLSLFSKFTRDQERGVAYLKEAIAELVQADDTVHQGFIGHLLPSYVSHILKVCLVATPEFRTEHAVQKMNLDRKHVERQLHKEDLERSEWTTYLFEKGPWDKRLYDIKIPMHSTPRDEVIELILGSVQSSVVKTTSSSQKAAHDFLLSARVNTALVEQGHDVEVTSKDGDVTIVINKYVLRMDHLRKQLSGAAEQVAGVKNVKTQEGPDFQAGYLMSKQKFELPAKVLLVDDEREFVQTLSERLQMRDVGTATVFDGEQALSVIEKEEPEVMILDLRMPGIDGMEVLREVKKVRPHVEVIILTGHGSERDKALAMELGAFAYLEKPVDIEALTKTLNAAYEKIKESRDSSPDEQKS